MWRLYPTRITTRLLLSGEMVLSRGFYYTHGIGMAGVCYERVACHGALLVNTNFEE